MIKSFGRILLRNLAGLRRMVYSALARRMAGSYEEPLTANGMTWLTKGVRLGKNANFNGLEVHGRGAVSIGDNFHSGVQLLMLTDIHDYDHGESIPYGVGTILKSIVIGDNVWIGSRVTILGGVTIGEGAIVQAGAVVVSDIPKCGIAGGSPAKVFKYRDVEHYDRLKGEGRFL